MLRKNSRKKIQFTISTNQNQNQNKSTSQTKPIWDKSVAEEVKDSINTQEKNGKHLMVEKKNIPWIRRMDAVKMSALPKAIYRHSHCKSNPNRARKERILNVIWRVAWQEART
jgi:hypothetical protein